MKKENKIIIKKALEEIEKQRKATRKKKIEEDYPEEKQKPIKHRIRKEGAWFDRYRR